MAFNKQPMYFVVLLPYILSYIGFILHTTAASATIDQLARFYVLIHIFIFTPLVFVVLACAFQKIFAENAEDEALVLRATYLVKFFGYVLSIIPIIVVLFTCYSEATDTFVIYFNFVLWFFCSINTIIQIFLRIEKVGECFCDLASGSTRKVG